MNCANTMHRFLFCGSIALGFLLNVSLAYGFELRAGVAKVDVTDRTAGPASDTLYAKALVLNDGQKTIAIITIDAVSIGEIGRIRNDFLSNLRKRLESELKIRPEHVIVNASHCHGIVAMDIEDRTFEAVRVANDKLQEVHAGVGKGFENRIMENRRLRLRDGSEADVRHAYSLPPDDAVISVGPIDPEIGILKLDRTDGKPLAIVYNFACHPIQGVPSKGNTADFPGYASKVIEENAGSDCMAFFIQGCAGDINPKSYKEVHSPRDAETFGNLLGLSVLKAIKSIQTRNSTELTLVREVLPLPRSSDLESRIAKMKDKQALLLRSLKGTSLNWKTFLPLYVKYQVSGDFPSDYSYRYLHERSIGRDDLLKMDGENRANLEAYLKNIQTMEDLTRLQINLDLLQRHQQKLLESGSRTVDAELVGLRIGDFRLITFPGELTVELGLRIKKKSLKEYTFVAGYTNGYIYYTPTAEQRQNRGWAQEDCDCMVAPEWQELFESKVFQILEQI